MKKVALVACSNPLQKSNRSEIEQLKKILLSLELEVVESPKLYMNTSYPVGEGKDRAEILNKFYGESSIDAIFDVSGGDMANEVLPYLDYKMIGEADKVFWGYSDLTTVINAIYAKTRKTSVLYQIRNLVQDSTGEQLERFRRYLNQEQELFRPQWNVLQGEGVVENMICENGLIGGNIRCFLKLAGTEYVPDVSGKMLFLEALSAKFPQVMTACASLQQMGVFEQIKGVLLGNFRHLEREEYELASYDVIKEFLPKNMLVAKTKEVGHGVDSKALFIG